MRLARIEEHGRQLEHRAGSNRVSLETRFARDCPYLLESDWLLLSSTLPLDKGDLHDTVVDIRHKVYPKGTTILAILQHGSLYSDIRHTARAIGISDTELADLLGFLNKIGGLIRKRTFMDTLYVLRTQALGLVLGKLYAPLSRRKTATAFTLWTGIVQATLPVNIGGTITASLFVIDKLATPSQVISFTCFGLSLFLVSMLVHEFGHLAIIIRSGQKTDVLQYGMRLGLVHKRLPFFYESRSALAGPIAGLLFCTLSAAGAACFHQTAYVFASLFIGLLHACSLLPWYGDGLSLRKSLQERRTTHEVRTDA